MKQLLYLNSFLILDSMELPLIKLLRKFVDQQTFGFCGRVLECLLNYDCTCTKERREFCCKAIIGIFPR